MFFTKYIKNFHNENETLVTSESQLVEKLILKRTKSFYLHVRKLQSSQFLLLMFRFPIPSISFKKSLNVE